MGVTIKQIAEKANVSPGTVDRALHGRPDIDPEVAKRILAIAKQLNYRPNTAAKALATSAKRRKITVLLQARGNAFYQDVLRGMEAAEFAFREYNIRLEFKLLKGYDIVRQIATLQEILDSDTEGLVITPIADKRVFALLDQMQEKKVAIVTLNANLPQTQKYCSVGADYYGCGQIAAGLFGMMTPKTQSAKVAVVAGSLKQSGHRRRVEGFTDTLGRDYPNITCCSTVLNDDDNELSKQRVAELLEQTPDLNGIFFCAGGIAGGLQAIKEAGCSDRLTVITVDETEPVLKALADRTAAATISQLPYEQGFQAIRTLCDKLVFGIEESGKSILMRNEVKLRYHYPLDTQED